MKFKALHYTLHEGGDTDILYVYECMYVCGNAFTHTVQSRVPSER